MLTARDLMISSPPGLAFDQTVMDAIKFMGEQDRGFVAVRADQSRYHGVLTEGSLMKIFLRYQQQLEKEALIFYRDLFEPLQLINENEPFPEVVKKVVTAVGNRVFVMNEKGQVSGFITARNILPLLSGGALQQTATNKKNDGDSINSNLYLYESFFTNSPFLMHSVNQEGTIKMANEMLHKILGYSYGDLIGKTIFDIYPSENHEKAKEGLKKIFNKGYHNVTTGVMVCKDGTKVNVELISRALTDQNQNPVGTVTISRPVDIKVLLKCLPE